MAKDSINDDRRSTNALLRKVTMGLRGERQQLDALLNRERDRLEKALARRVGRGRDQLTGSLGRLRDLQQQRTGGSLLSRLQAGVQSLVPTSLGAGRRRRARLLSRRTRRVVLRVDGRRVVLRAGHRTDLERARRGLADHDARLHSALTADARTLAELAANHERLAIIVGELQAKRYMAWILEIYDRLANLDLGWLRLRRRQRKLRRRNRSTRVAAKQQTKLVEQRLTTLTRDARINVVRKAAMTMQVAAFGTRGDLFARNNLVLAGNEVAWGLGGEVVGGLGWATPAGSLATGSVVADPDLAGQPTPTFDPLVIEPGPNRYISGVVTGTGWEPVLDTGIVALVDLEPFTPPELWAAFSARTNVPVMLNIISPVMRPTTIWGNAEFGQLRIILLIPTPPPTSGQIIDGGLQGRWVIDVLAPSVDPGPEPVPSVIII